MIREARSIPIIISTYPHRFMEEQHRKQEQRMRQFAHHKHEEHRREEQHLRDKEQYQKEQERHRQELQVMEKQRLQKEEHRKLVEARMMELEMAKEFQWLQRQNRDPQEETERLEREQFVHLLKREGIRDEIIYLLIKQEVYSVQTLRACSQKTLMQIGISLGQVLILKKIA